MASYIIFNFFCNYESVINKFTGDLEDTEQSDVQFHYIIQLLF